MDAFNSELDRQNDRVKSKRAFTLIELLVTISIIALLIAILLPALRTARDVAKASVCLNQQRQVGLAGIMYLDDYEENFPVIISSYAPYSVLLDRGGYTSTIEVFFDPTLPPGQVVQDAQNLSEIWNRPDGYTAALHTATYAIRWAHPQYKEVGAGATRYRYIPMKEVTQPSTSMIIADTANRGMYQVFRVAPDTSAWSQIHFRHQDASNMLFLDGHAAGIDLAGLSALDTDETLYYWDDSGPLIVP